METPEVGLTEELIPDMPEMQLEENVIEETFEIPQGNIILFIRNPALFSFLIRCHRLHCPFNS